MTSLLLTGIGHLTTNVGEPIRETRLLIEGGSIVAVDPESMTILETVYESKGAPMGAGTVGLQVGDELFIGSFKGDRILRVELPDR